MHAVLSRRRCTTLRAPRSFDQAGLVQQPAICKPTDDRGGQTAGTAEAQLRYRNNVRNSSLSRSEQEQSRLEGEGQAASPAINPRAPLLVVQSTIGLHLLYGERRRNSDLWTV